MNGVYTSITPAFQSITDVIREWRNGRKIEAIKIYRGIYGVGLKEAKDACEAIGAALESVPAPKPEPKFKVGDKVVDLYESDDVGTIVRVEDGKYAVLFASFGHCDPSGLASVWSDKELKPVKTGSFIVAVFERGQYRPNANPFIHTEESAAIAEAERLSKKHVGQKFGTFALIADSETPPSDTKTVRV
jgi:hypothetical protein